MPIRDLRGEIRDRTKALTAGAASRYPAHTMGDPMRRGINGIDPSWDQHAIPLTVRFSEVDSMRIVWHGHYLTHCE